MTEKTILKLDLKDKSYDIIIGHDILSDACSFIKNITSNNHFIIVSDNKIPTVYAETITASIEPQAKGDIRKSVKVDKIIIPSGEASKSFSQLEDLLNEIFALKPDRNVTLIALGGGVIGDLTGFAASILLRGVNFIQIPTTLLSQVDSSVGGKTGVNNKFGKNLVGSFYQPKLVLIDINTLSSLNKREFLAGYAEIVKYAIINDKEFFYWLDENIADILAKKPKALQYIIEKSCQAKANIVQQDEKEKGVRALLNLGHTFGHALEQQCGYDGTLLHGEAVAIGMIMAMHMSYEVGSLKDINQIELVTNHFKKAGLATSPIDIKNNWNLEKLLEALSLDKKVSNGQLIFILCEQIGKCYIDKKVTFEQAKKIFSRFL